MWSLHQVVPGCRLHQRPILLCRRRRLRNKPVLVRVPKSEREQRQCLLCIRATRNYRVLARVRNLVKVIRPRRSRIRHFGFRLGKAIRRRAMARNNRLLQRRGQLCRVRRGPMLRLRLRQMLPPRKSQYFHIKRASWTGQIVVGMQIGMGHRSIIISRGRRCFIS